jgi:hypothetical protein
MLSDRERQERYQYSTHRRLPMDYGDARAMTQAYFTTSGRRRLTCLSTTSGNRQVGRAQLGLRPRKPLLDAIGNARRDAYLTRRRQAARQEQLCRQEREAAQREAWRPVCKDCGQKFTDDRWEAIGHTGDWSKRQSHSHLCENCQDRPLQRSGRPKPTNASAAARRQRNRPPCRRPAAGFPACAPDPDKPQRPTGRASPNRPRARLRCRWRLGRTNDDEQLLNGRVYGAVPDDPNPGPLPHRTYAEPRPV